MMIRQGDILIIPVGEIPMDGASVHTDGVIARGEATGHAHRVDPKRAQVITLERNGEVFEYLRVFEPVFITHEEHAAVRVEPGIYEVRRQRELSLADAASYRLVRD